LARFKHLLKEIHRRSLWQTVVHVVVLVTAVCTLPITLGAAWLCLELVRQWRRGEVPLEYPLYAVPSVAIALTRWSMQGNPRYMALCFPLFAALALILRHRPDLRLWLVYGCGTLQGVYAVSMGLGHGWALAMS